MAILKRLFNTYTNAERDRNMGKLLRHLLTGICLIALTGCVTEPYHRQWVSAHSPIKFGGFAIEQGAEMRIQAYHKQRHEWVTLKTVRANTSPIDVNGDQLYSWSTNVLFTNEADWTCYWGMNSYCTIPAGSAQAEVRVLQVHEGVERGTIFFEESGLRDCLGDQLNSGEGGFAAGLQCRVDDSSSLILNMLT